MEKTEENWDSISLMLVLVSFNSLLLKSTKKVFDSGSFAKTEAQQIIRTRSVANFFIASNILFNIPRKQKYGHKKSPKSLKSGIFQCYSFLKLSLFFSLFLCFPLRSHLLHRQGFFRSVRRQLVFSFHEYLLVFEEERC